MGLFDWTLVIATLFAVVAIGLYTQRFVRSVADFMSAGRKARRYLLAVGRAEMQAGAAVYVMTFEIINHSGFVYTWWMSLPRPILLLVAIFGFVVYRYRQTRAITLGQFFEIRYSKRLRVATGMLGFFAGLLNFGIIPVIGARVMVYLLGFPGEFHVSGLTIPTYVPLMAFFLLVNVFVTLSGGIITILVTNCFEGIACQVLYLFIIFGLLATFSWSQISATMTAQPPGQSFLDPFDSFQTKDFNLWLVLMGIAGSIYGTMAWQNQSAYNSAPLTAHESVMGNLLGQWRQLGQAAVMTLLAICAMTYLHDQTYAAGAARVHAELSQITNAQTREEMEIPIALTHILPAGLRGALCTILLLGIFGGDSSHLHSWGSLFIQDVVLPLRRRAFTPEQHLRWLRWSIVGVALFVFFFGIFFPLTDYVSMWWSVTMAVYIGGAGAIIIGGLYWARGTTPGAWASLAAGFTCSLGGIIAQQCWGSRFPLNGAQIGFVTMLVAVIFYVAVSLLTCREIFNMDRMLHCGPYAKPDDIDEVIASPRRLTWSRLIGCDANFTRGDRWIASSLLIYFLAFFFITLGVTAWCLVRPWSLATWSSYWHFNAIVLPIFIAIVTSIWFTWGGVRDAIDLFRRLREETVNPLDNGVVIGHQNLDDIAKSQPAATPSVTAKTPRITDTRDRRENEMADR